MPCGRRRRRGPGLGIAPLEPRRTEGSEPEVEQHRRSDTRSTRYATATSAANPAPATSAQQYRPSSRASTVGTAPVSPRSAARRKMSAITGPGDAEISRTASRNAGSDVASSTPGWCRGPFPPG